MATSQLTLWLCVIWTISITKSQFETNKVGNYIIVYNPSMTFDWYSALNYCETQFGTSLASLHSEDDYNTILNGLINTDRVCTWIGLNDISNEAGYDGTITASWEYSDGTPYNWELDWYGSEPSPLASGLDNDCVYLFTGDVLYDEGFLDVWCDAVNNDFTQFVCNAGSCDHDLGECNNSPCSCNEINNCNVCHSNGCDECKNGYFKKDYNYNCISCSDTFGEGCLFCQDFNGCGQCDDGYLRVKNEACGLYECIEDEDDCNDSSNDIDEAGCPIPCDYSPCTCDELCFCDSCHENGCNQCESGYFKKSYNYPCINCQEMFGKACMFCQDFDGCGQCTEGCTREYNNECGLWECNCDNCQEKITLLYAYSEPWVLNGVHIAQWYGDYYYTGVNSQGYPYYNHVSTDAQFYISTQWVADDFWVRWNVESSSAWLFYGDGADGKTTLNADGTFQLADNNPLDGTLHSEWIARSYPGGGDMIAILTDCPGIGLEA